MRPRKRRQSAVRGKRARPQQALRKSAQPRRPRPGTRPARRALRAQSHCRWHRRLRHASAPTLPAGPIPIWWTTWRWRASAARPSARPSPVPQTNVQQRNSGIGKAQWALYAALGGVQLMLMTCSRRPALRECRLRRGAVTLAVAAASVRAVFHLIPNTLPLLAPTKRPPALHADLLR